MMDNDFEKKLQRSLLGASIMSGAVKGGVVSGVVIAVMGGNSLLSPVQTISACIFLAVVLDLLWFYVPNLSRHREHCKSSNPHYLIKVKGALERKGAYWMVSNNWFARDMNEILMDDE